jgi:hypothetical protein
VHHAPSFLFGTDRNKEDFSTPVEMEDFLNSTPLKMKKTISSEAERSSLFVG